jgi:hypothetical protein
MHAHTLLEGMNLMNRFANETNGPSQPEMRSARNAISGMGRNWGCGAELVGTKYMCTC